MEEPVADKATIRANFRKRRDAISEIRRKEGSLALLEEVFTLIPERGGVLSFVARNSEIEMEPINSKLRAQGRLFLPEVDGLQLKIVPEGEVVAALVPGLAFDHKGYRIGYGGGHFDRFLATCPSLYTVGVGFKEQLFNGKLPHEPHDIPMRKIALF